MRLFRFRGGIHPDDHKGPTAQIPISEFPLPKRLYIPVQQHIGNPAQAIVAPGQKVLKGELLAKAKGGLSAPVHAPTSGEVVSVEDHAAPHPSGLAATTIVLEPDGKDAWIETRGTEDPFALTPEIIGERVAGAGIVGMGGAAFPSAVKLSAAKERAETLIINGAECEPYLTCDDRLMQERADAVIDGIRIMLHALGTNRALIAIENNKPDAQTAMRRACEDFPGIEIIGVPTLYPMGSEKQMIMSLTGREIPAGKRSADIGVIVHNVATAYAVHEAIREGRPLIRRIVTVGGAAIRKPANLEVPIGTLAADLIAHCGGLGEEPARLVMGGPMMGVSLPHTDIPMVKGSNGILGLTKSELHSPKTSSPCIRCARCVQVCPVGLLPLQMAAHSRRGDVEGAARLGLEDCISCGTCSYICPAGIPLTQYFNYAKGALAARRAEKQKGELTRKLAQARQERLERQAREKKEAAARRKAEREAAKAAAAKSAGEERKATS